MSLKCTARLDRKTPRELLLFREHIEVAFDLSNYGVLWVILGAAATAAATASTAEV